MAIGRRLVGAWERFWFEPGPASRLGLGRAIFCGAAFLFYLRQDFSEWATAAPVFWMPIPLFEKLHLEVASADILFAAQIVWKISLLMCALGWSTRFSTAVAAVFGTYLLGLPHNFGATQHFDAIVVFAFIILAFSRAGDARSIDAVIRARRGIAPPPARGPEYTWPIRAMWVATALIFFGAGTSKLRNGGLEWVFSDNLRLLLMRAYYHVSDGDPLTSWGLVVAKQAWMSRWLALTTLLVETLYIAGLFSRRVRPIMGLSGVLLLVGIRLLMGPTFESFLMCGLLVVPWHRVEALSKRWAHSAVATRRAAVLTSLLTLLALLLAASA